MRELLIAIRRYTWMTELVALLVLLLVYKFTSSTSVLACVVLWPVIMVTSMVGLTLVLDEVETSEV